jgi:glycosyltransferase involved in cell wall biosynthesis
MALVRIYLLTYRRPRLLARALESLRAQTFSDWVCELHNDAPDDDTPGRLVAGINDPRIQLHQHTTNWGSAACFNHVFRGGPEPFLSLLEDDNWWEPEFLATALAAISAESTVNVVWANMRIWTEQRDGTWADTGRTVWTNPSANPTPCLFHWPVLLQAFDALHSNGAMLVRADASRTAIPPPETPFDIFETIRERLLGGGWLLLPDPLANFAITLGTARSPHPADWARAQLMVASSFLSFVDLNFQEAGLLWSSLRPQRPRATSLLFHVAMAGVRPWTLLRHAQAGDWIHFLAGAIRHPIALVNILRFRSLHRTTWATLRAGAAARTREASAHGRKTCLLYRKNVPIPSTVGLNK